MTQGTLLRRGTAFAAALALLTGCAPREPAVQPETPPPPLSPVQEEAPRPELPSPPVPTPPPETERAAPKPPTAWDPFSDTWVATDELGRTLPTHDSVGPPREDRTVAMFYFIWQGGHPETTSGPHDISRILAENPGDRRWGPVSHFPPWGEPGFGYYLADDASVIRKHLQMLADAGVDVLVIDCTNGFTYRAHYSVLLQEMASRRSHGMPCPQIAFFANGRATETLYRELYQPGIHRDAWCRWKGKPLILVKTSDLPDVIEEIRDFFTIRQTWGLQRIDEPREWSFLQVYPQDAGWDIDRGQPEFMNVSVAQQRPRMSDPTACGRSFSLGGQPKASQQDHHGHNVAQQWVRALSVDPELIFVTGWNEWVAQRFKDDQHEARFVDQYSKEFSRDIEPMKGGHEDAYYYQFVSYVRQYKGARPLPGPVSCQTPQIDGVFDDWADVEPEYRDDIGDPVRRDHPGWAAAGPYVNDSGRNDIVVCKVAFDHEGIYFYVRTREPISPPEGASWMLLLIDSDNDPSTGWLGYDCMVNRKREDHLASLHLHAGEGYRWTSPGAVPFRAVGNEMELSIPRAVLGIRRLPATLDFKWADNIRHTGEASDFTLNGDAAPNDRFNYRAVF